MLHSDKHARRGLFEEEEKRWRCPTGLDDMLDLLGGRATDRKLRLFGVACCRRIWDFLSPEGKRAAEAAEGFADGTVSHQKMGQANTETWSALDTCSDEAAVLVTTGLTPGTLKELVSAAAGVTVWTGTPRNRRGDENWQRERLEEINLLYDVFGNPFRPAAYDPAWRTADVLAVAESIYAGRRWEEMPVLGDALEDAGCADEEVLRHCRHILPHARGCWVVDGLLGKS